MGDEDVLKVLFNHEGHKVHTKDTKIYVRS